MTYQHSINTSLFCGIFGKWAELDAKDLELLCLGGLVHDIGKLLIPQEIVQKKGSLTEEEYKLIQTHPVKGYELLKNKQIDDSIAILTLSHHERYDGSGYPFGLKGNRLTKSTMLLAISDVYEALTAKRCYKQAVCPFEALRIFEKDGLQKFGPDFLVSILKNIAEIYINNDVLLSNGEKGKIVFINQNAFSRPIVSLGENIFKDLSKEKDLYILELL
jgi:HD-GYP domain-containing protein (c-di-GMP phosphodiesterase class II)